MVPIPEPSQDPKLSPDGMPLDAQGRIDYGSDQNRKRIRTARFALMFVGVVSLGMVIFQTVMLSNELERYGVSFGDMPALVMLLVVLAFAVSLTFVALSFVAKTRPFGASLAGLIIYLSDLLIGGAIEPENLPKGVVIKVIIIIALIQAVKAGLDFRKYKRSVEVKQAFS